MSHWTSRTRWWSLLNAETLFGRDFFLQAIWLTSITTRKFYNIRGRHSTQNIWNNATSRTGWFTMPMDQCTLHCQCSHFWLLKLAVVPHPPHSHHLAHCEFFFFTKNEIMAMMVQFSRCLWNSGSIANHLTCDYKTSVPAVLPRVTETLNPLHNSEWDYFEGDNNNQ